MSIQVEIAPEFNGINSNSVRAILDQILTIEGAIAEEITVIFWDDQLLNSLKKEFFNVDQFTDVIAFRLNEYEEKHVEGEIYISVNRAQENADQFSVPISHEIGRLIIHGCLHLLNYDDKTENEKIRMREKENGYLKKCKWKEIILG